MSSFLFLNISFWNRKFSQDIVLNKMSKDFIYITSISFTETAHYEGLFSQHLSTLAYVLALKLL